MFREKLRLGFLRKKRSASKETESPTLSETTKVLSATATDSAVSEAKTTSNFKSTIERIKALETERKNLLLEIEELKRMADAKAKALESEINISETK